MDSSGACVQVSPTTGEITALGAPRPGEASPEAVHRFRFDQVGDAGTDQAAVCSRRSADPSPPFLRSAPPSHSPLSYQDAVWFSSTAHPFVWSSQLLARSGLERAILVGLSCVD